ncbi:MAG: ShlB/FhaC/HecB family hemolysin secretion/activation protein [Proteobacteria bacterium]|nr:ShlB/FhaC/HecB family hemolysin secretion/activation protein [Pseudomonadota bacterium]
MLLSISSAHFKPPVFPTLAITKYGNSGYNRHGCPWAIRLFLIVLACLPLALYANEALAQTQPEFQQGKELQRQQERERQLREQQEKTPDVRLPTAPVGAPMLLPANESPCFPIERIELDDPTGDFAWAAAAADLPGDPAVGRCLGSQGINLVMARIQNAIVERGYVTTRVLAGPQDLTTGRLTLRLIPGRIRAIRFTDDSDARANAWNVFPAGPGDLLNLRDIEHALENLKRVPTAEADIQIVPTENLGESDLVITWKQSFPLRLTLSANDGGADTTGKYLGSVTLSGDHLLTLNDLFYASVNHDLGGGDSGNRGTRGHTVHYSLPFGYWTLGATTSANRYHQSVAGINQTYLYRGTSENHELKLSRLLHRDAAGKTSASLRGYLTQSNNYIDDTEVDVQRRRMAGWEAGLGHRRFLGDATLELNGAYRRGTGAFNALEAPEDDFDEGTARPRLWSADAALTVPFRIGALALRYNGTWRAQWNRTPLVPQDRFSIGGRYTVRGFDGENVLMAERGFLIRNDLSLALGASGQELYLGLDHGRVGGQSADLLVGRSLTGAVIGLRGGYKDVSYDLFVGGPLDKPEYFETNHLTTGFNLTLSF